MEDSENKSKDSPEMQVDLEELAKMKEGPEKYEGSDFIRKFLPAFEDAIKFLSNPRSTWEEVKKSDLLIRDFYLNYFVYIAAIPAIFGFFGTLIASKSFTAALWNNLLIFLMSLAWIYLMALIIEKIALRLEGKINHSHAVQYMGYTATPSLIAGVTNLVPSAWLSWIPILASFYGLYLFYQAIGWMTAVAEHDKPKFMAYTLLSALLVGMVFALILSILMYVPM